MELENDNDEQDVFQENKYYIPFVGYHRKYLRNGFFVSATLFISLIIIVVVIFSHNSTVIAKESENNNSLQSKLIILVNESKLISFDTKWENSSLSRDITATCPDNFSKYLDVHVDGRINCDKKKNISIPILLEDRKSSESYFIIDEVSQKIYMVDTLHGNLVVIDANTGYFNILLSGLDHPLTVMLDYNSGLMFILQNSVDSILRANIDGSELKKIVSIPVGLLRDMTIDLHRKRVYWISQPINIESSNYEGENRQSVYSGNDLITKLIILEDRLYWVESNRFTILFSCKIDIHDVCQDVKSHDIGNVGGMKFIKSFLRSNPSMKNPCQVENGGCQHLCLMNGKNNKSCVCHMGWQLNPDEHTCHEVQDYLIYVVDGLIRVTDIIGSKDVLLPTRYKTDSLKSKENIDFDYDVANDDFYYSDDYNVFKIKLKSKSNRTRVYQSTNELIFGQVAYDWYTGNLYVGLQATSLTPTRHYLAVFKSSIENKNLEKVLYSYTFDSSCSYAIALNPSKGHVFFGGIIDSRAHICTLHVNGTRIQCLNDPFMLFTHNCPYVSVDYSTDHLYWIFASEDITMVAHSEFDGSDLMYVVIEDVSRGTIVDVHQSWIYLSNRTSIWRVNKKTGKDAVRIALTNGKMGAMKIVSGAMQFRDKINPCQEDNGGCEQFCYAKPRVTCDCQDGKKVESDGRCYHLIA